MKFPCKLEDIPCSLVQGIAAPTIGNPGLRRIFTAGHKGILKPDSLQNRLEQGNRTVPKKGPGTKSNGRKSAPIRLLLGSAHGPFACPTYWDWTCG